MERKITDEIGAEQLYVQATTIDPRFALAYARASMLNSYLFDDFPERKAKARAQAEEALRLSPSLGEAHLALGLCLDWGDKNYDAALKEYEIAAATSPNIAEIHWHLAVIYRRQGRWREAIASFDRALSLDPRNGRSFFTPLSITFYVRDWSAAAAGFTQHAGALSGAYWGQQDQPCLLGSVSERQSVCGQNHPAKHSAALCFRRRRRFGALGPGHAGTGLCRRRKDLDRFSLRSIFLNPKIDPKTFYQGRTALARGDSESAQRYFAATLPALEEAMRKDPDDPDRHADLGLLYAYMNRKADAIREGRRAVELEPESKNAFHGAGWAANLALVYALTGEQDQAITLIERLLSTPGPVGAHGGC